MARVDILIIWSASKHVGDAVDGPSTMQKPRVTENTRGEIGRPWVLVPEIHRDQCWHDEAKEYGQEPVVSEKVAVIASAEGKAMPLCLLSLEYQDRVFVQITQVDGFALLDNVRMLADQKPSHMGEEEAPCCVMRIRVRLRVPVVDTVVARPFNDVILKSRVLANDQDHETRTLCAYL